MSGTSKVSAVLAQFRKGQKAAIQVQAEARQEREDKLAKAEAGALKGAARF